MSLTPPIPVSALAPILRPASIEPRVELGENTSGAAFHAAFTDAVAKVESFQKNAELSVNRFLSGEGEELHQVALATQHAELSFDLFMQVRNKVVAAYEEVLRMQV